MLGENKTSTEILAQFLLDIVQTASNAGNFKTLVSALQAADLVTSLKGAGSFTVFAPNDAAFSKLVLSTLNDLLKTKNKRSLTRILKYHVIAGQRITSADLNRMFLPFNQDMLDGGYTRISRVGNSLKINNATVVLADIMAANGVIHVIDQVLIPPKANRAVSVSISQSFWLALLLPIFAFF